MAQLHQALESKNPAVAANAVIFAARAGAPSKGAPLSSQLAQIVGNAKLKLPQRCAAAESLGLLREKDTATTIQALLDEYAQQQQSAGYVVDLHVDLLHALSWHVPPSGDRRFGVALQSKSAEVRIAAFEGWTINADDELPEAVAELRQDPDPRVRSAALLSLAVHRHPQAHEYLSLAIEDRDFSVRMAAIAALGRLGGEEARSTLEHMKNHPSEIARSAVVAALGDRRAPTIKSSLRRSTSRRACARQWRRCWPAPARLQGRPPGINCAGASAAARCQRRGAGSRRGIAGGLATGSCRPRALGRSGTAHV